MQSNIVVEDERRYPEKAVIASGGCLSPVKFDGNSCVDCSKCIFAIDYGQNPMSRWQGEG